MDACTPDLLAARERCHAPGNRTLRAAVKNVGRSQVVPIADSVALTIPSPVKADHQILDAAMDVRVPDDSIVDSSLARIASSTPVVVGKDHVTVVVDDRAFDACADVPLDISVSAALRVRGERGIFPTSLKTSLAAPASPVRLGADIDNALAALTSPMLVNFNGPAPFAP
ncbi:MAG: hypothetical protein HOV81_24575 [Kofleriaceae bacterium]|nr:hypothetical protein [Kofleriaceae bacterium]